MIHSDDSDNGDGDMVGITKSPYVYIGCRWCGDHISYYVVIWWYGDLVIWWYWGMIWIPGFPYYPKKWQWFLCNTIVCIYRHISIIGIVVIVWDGGMTWWYGRFLIGYHQLHGFLSFSTSNFGAYPGLQENKAHGRHPAT